MNSGTDKSALKLTQLDSNRRPVSRLGLIDAIPKAVRFATIALSVRDQRPFLPNDNSLQQA